MAEYKSQKAGPGVVICVALVALTFLIFAVGKSSFFVKTRDLTFYFDSASGIQERSKVTYAGRRCGEIRTVRILQPAEEKTDPAGNRYFVEVKARVEVSTPVNQDTKASIMMVGLIGEKQLNLTPGDPNAPALAADDALYGSNAGFERIAAIATKLTARLEATLVNVDALLINVNDITKDAKFKEDVKATIANARSTLAKAEATLAEAKDLIGENREKIKTTLDQVHELADEATMTVTNLQETLTEARPRLLEALDRLKNLTANLETNLEPKVTVLVQKATDTLDTANGMLAENRTNISLLIANGRDTLNQTRHTTHTFRFLFAPWTLFNTKNADVKKPAVRTNEPAAPTHAAPDAAAGSGSTLAPTVPPKPPAR